MKPNDYVLIQGEVKMKKLFKGMHILVGMCLFAMLFVACPNNAQGGEKPNPAEKKDILIKSITLGGISCEEGKDVFVGEDQAELVVELKEACEDLIVKVNNGATTVVTQGKKVKYNLQGITEAGLTTKIDITAKNKNAKSFNFVAKKLGMIGLESVTFDDVPCAENATIDVNKSEGNVKVTFEQAYEGLSVTIAGKPAATLVGKVATGKIESISEEGTEIKIESTANGKKPFSYKFTLKKLKLSEIGIESVTFDDMSCAENATIETEKAEGDVKVTFVESYAGLSVTIAGTTATITGKEATAKIENITLEGIEVSINATATGKEAKTYKFTLKKLPPLPEIRKLSFKGKNIDPTAQFYKDGKDYFSDKAPFIKDIKADGSTKIGDVKESKLEITLKYTGTPSNPKLEIKNVTTDVTTSSTTASPVLSTIDVSTELKKGDNVFILTYSEDGKRPFVLKFIVGYDEPKYEPISRIVVHGKWFATEDAFASLENGSESITVAGKASAEVEVEMPETWYYDTAEFTLKIDGVSCPKTDFQKTAWGENAKWTVKKDVALDVGTTKELKIEFENTTRSYKKEYKVNLVHYAVNELDSLIFAEATTTKKIDSKVYSSFKFDAEKSYYKAKTNFKSEDRTENVHFFLSSKDSDATVKYAVSTTLVEPKDISAWQDASKKNVSYIDGSETITKEAYAIENQALNYGSQYLYILLEKGAIKTYYITEVLRDKVKADDVSGDQELVYQDDGGNKLADGYPLATKGLIRVLPTNPRAKVALVTPEEKDFEKKTDGWFECQIELPEDKTKFSYKIIGEDTTKEKLYNDSYYQAFSKAPLIKELKFAYKENTAEYQKKLVGNVDGTHYLSFDKELAKDKKIYLFVKAYKGLGIAVLPDFTEKKKTETETLTNYVFELDVTSLVDAAETKKEYSLNLTLDSKPCNPFKVTAFLQDEIIKSMFVRGKKCVQLPEGNKWVCKADMNISAYKRFIIDLYLLQNETPKNTNRLVKMFQDGEEKLLTINEKAKNVLSFEYKDFEVASNQKITLKIQYFADKTQTATPTKEYTLEIEDI